MSEAAAFGLLFGNGVVVYEVISAAIHRLQIGMTEIHSGVDDSDTDALAACEEPYRWRIDAGQTPGRHLRDVEVGCGHREDEALDIRFHVTNAAGLCQHLCFLIRKLD